MKFKQYENGSCDIEFSIKERWIILKKGKIYLSDEALRHFGNKLVQMVADWNLNFNKKTQEKITYNNTEIEGK
jgi:hypothetical protein